MNVPLWVWISVLVGIAAIFTVSLIFGRKAHVIGVAEASKWVTAYVCLAVLFGIGVFIFAGPQYGGEFFAGCATEYALSIDNLFVFVILLTSFAVPRDLQGRVVLIGIMIALVLRGALIAVGAVLISTFSWVFYLFGLFLVITAWRLAREKRAAEDDSKEPGTVALLRRFLPVSEKYNGTTMTIRVDGKKLFTPMFAVILALGVTDVLFALDSIPAIFGLTKEPFLVFTANAFAILGLRAMYFLLADLIHRFIYLKIGLAFVLIWVGIKMLLLDVFYIPTTISLAVVVTIITVSIVASLRATRGQARRDVQATAAGAFRIATDEELAAIEPVFRRPRRVPAGGTDRTDE